MDTFNGNSIHIANDTVGEYPFWACSFFEKRYASNQLKMCFNDNKHALKTFENELVANHLAVKEHGLMFSPFVDPMLPETMNLTCKAVHICIRYKVPVRILTKISGWEKSMIDDPVSYCNQELIAIGYILTEKDEQEFSTNSRRINGLYRMHSAGFKTFVSIDPVEDFSDALFKIRETKGFCDLYKIGIDNNKPYLIDEVTNFIYDVFSILKHTPSKIYFKDSIMKKAAFSRESLPKICVTKDYNLFKT